jgi:hypothetical protein
MGQVFHARAKTYSGLMDFKMDERGGVLIAGVMPIVIELISQHLSH